MATTLEDFEAEVQRQIVAGKDPAGAEGFAGLVLGTSREQLIGSTPPPGDTGGGDIGSGGGIAFKVGGSPQASSTLPGGTSVPIPTPSGTQPRIPRDRFGNPIDVTGLEEFKDSNGRYPGEPGYLNIEFFDRPGDSTPDPPPADSTPPPPPPEDFSKGGPSIPPNVTGTVGGLTEEDPRLTSLIERFTAGGITDEESRIQEGRFIDEQREGSSALRQDLADRFASQGVSGGKAQGALGQIFGQTQRGIAEGVSNIRLNTLNKQLESRGRALATLLQQAGLSTQEAISIAQFETQRAISEGQLQLGNRRLSLEAELGRGDLGLRRDQLASNEEIAFASLELERLLGVENIDLAREENETGLIMFLLELANNANEAQRNAIFEYLELLGFDIGPNVSIS